MESRDVKEERAEAAERKAAEELEESRVGRERQRASMDEVHSDQQQQQQQRPAGVLGTILKAVHDTFDHAKDTTTGKTQEPEEKTRETTYAAAHKAVETKDAAAEKTKGTTQSTSDRAREVKEAAAQKTSSTAHTAAGKARGAKDAAAEKAKQGTEATTQYKDYAADKARERKESAAEKAKEYKEDVAEKSRETKESVAEKAKQAKETAEEKARRAMGYVEDKKEETKEKAGETTETAKEKARQEMEEMKLRDEDRDDLDRARVDATKVEEASERGKANILTAIGNVTGTIKEKLMGAKDTAENKQEEVSKQGAGKPVLDKDGDGLVGARRVLVIDKGTKFDDVAQTLTEADQETGQTCNDVHKIGGEDVVMIDPKK